MYGSFCVYHVALGHVLGYSSSCSSIQVSIISDMEAHTQYLVRFAWILDRFQLVSPGIDTTKEWSNVTLKQYTECWRNDIAQNRTHVKYGLIMFNTVKLCRQPLPLNYFRKVFQCHYRCPLLYPKFTLQWSHSSVLLPQKKNCWQMPGPVSMATFYWRSRTSTVVLFTQLASPGIYPAVAFPNATEESESRSCFQPTGQEEKIQLGLEMGWSSQVWE